MRIAVFTTDDFIPPVGGAEVALGEIISRNPDIHFDVYCAKLFSGRAREQAVGNATIIRFGFACGVLDKILFTFFSPRAALRRHRREPYDLAWSMMASWGGLAASAFKRLTNVPYLLTLQEGDSLEALARKTRFIRGRFRRIFEQADGLQAISQYLARWGMTMGFHGKLSRVIPNAVDVERFARPAAPEALAETRAAWGFPRDAFTLITVSRLVKKNGIGDVIEALPLLPANVCFVIYGFGPLEEELKARVATLGLDGRVRFGGRIENEKLPRFLKAADAFIRPSLTEGLGISFLEALAAGVPVVATPVGGIPDFLTDGVTGFMCRPDDPRSIAAAVGRIMRLTETERMEVVARAQAMMRERYDWKKIVKDMRTIFEEAARVKPLQP